MKRFENKVVVVTGASRGIGQAICAAFAGAGAKVVGVARSGLEETASKCGSGFIVINADLGTGKQKDAMDVMAQITQKTGRIDALVNNAGTIRRAPAVDYSEKDWNEILQINLSAPFFLCQAA